MKKLPKIVFALVIAATLYACNKKEESEAMNISARHRADTLNGNPKDTLLWPIDTTIHTNPSDTIVNTYPGDTIVNTYPIDTTWHTNPDNPYDTIWPNNPID